MPLPRLHAGRPRSLRAALWMATRPTHAEMAGPSLSRRIRPCRTGADRTGAVMTRPDHLCSDPHWLRVVGGTDGDMTASLDRPAQPAPATRSEEHPSELQ